MLTLRALRSSAVLPFLLTIALTLAQAPPDLSGTWVIDREHSSAVGGGRGGGGGEGSGRGGATTTVGSSSN